MAIKSEVGWTRKGEDWDMVENKLCNARFSKLIWW